jgi:predicted DNA binding CopG/RHH family protein
MSREPIEYEDLGDVELPPEQDALARAAIEQAERDIEATRVDFRWGRAQVELVKRVAALMGVPYQTYLKQVVYRQALADLKALGEADQALKKLAS